MPAASPAACPAAPRSGRSIDLGSILPVVDFAKAGSAISLAPRVSNVCVRTSKLGKTDYVIKSKNWFDAYTGTTCTAG